MDIKRRDFLKRGLTVGFVAGTTFAINPYKNLLASPLSEEYDAASLFGQALLLLFLVSSFDLFFVSDFNS